MTLSQIERRLTTLERKLAAISSRDATIETPDVNSWIDEIHGTFKDDASYRKAARLGRAVAQGPTAIGVASPEGQGGMIILDTDVFSLLELPDSPAYLRLRARIAQLDPPQQAATTVITYEEQSRGRLATVNSARSPKELAEAYRHLRQHILNYRKIPIVEFDDAAAETAARLQKSKLRMGTLDLRIAAIALTRDALLLSRNLQDFRKVPHLRVEDWTLP